MIYLQWLKVKKTIDNIMLKSYNLIGQYESRKQIVRKSSLVGEQVYLDSCCPTPNGSFIFNMTINSKFKNREILYQKYVVEKMSTTKIAGLVGTGHRTVCRWMIKLGIPRRSKSEANIIFREKNPNHQKGENSSNWKGGRKKSSDGYILIYKPGHPYCCKKGYIMEHRLIVEKAIERYLKPEEIIHHVNGNKTDNRPRNLLVCKFQYHMWIHRKMKQLNFEYKLR